MTSRNPYQLLLITIINIYGLSTENLIIVFLAMIWVFLDFIDRVED